jgi:hypothetical protein
VWGLPFLWPFCVFVYISVVEEGVCVRDCRGLGLCKISKVIWVMSVKEGGIVCSEVRGEWEVKESSG